MHQASSHSGIAGSVGPSDGGKRSRTGRALRAAAAVLFGTFLGLAILEVSLRLTSWELKGVHHIGSLHRHHPILGREQVPDREILLAGGHEPIMYRINSHGFRDADPVQQERTPGVPRIVFLGDSLVWGWGVREEDAVSERLEELTGVEALNMAVCATGTGQAWQMLQERGVGFDPDIVVLGFYVGNDYRNNISRSSKRPQFDLDDEGHVVVENVPVPQSLSQSVSDFVKEHSLSYFFIQYEAKQLKKRIKRASRAAAKTEPEETRYLDDDAKAGEEDITLLSKYRKQPEAAIQQSYDLTRALLGEIRDTCEEHGIELLVAVIPDNFQVHDDMWADLLAEAPDDPSRYDQRKPTDVCLDMCRELGVEVVDLLPAMRAAREAGDEVFIPDNIHWEPKGHEVAAEVIRDKLVDLDWLQQP